MLKNLEEKKISRLYKIQSDCFEEVNLKPVDVPFASGYKNGKAEDKSFSFASGSGEAVDKSSKFPSGIGSCQNEGGRQ